ncbi:glycoside hydrolase family 55 protein [Pleurocapsa sp. PCC 7319]|uniref:glycoside hydrolase family 55 protein n=1 Tax=Pleurocapsa sp. PCC 7319 TaxID=118161 RepID=UPI00034DCF9A|nr:glycoside hydrolase family 55 protein [Pleurocapsa sp. PCC 7319]
MKSVKVVYPLDANFVNVRDYGAKGDGKIDDTEAILQAVQQNLMQHRTLFFPTGTYIVSDVLEWKRENGTFGAFLTWQGEGMGHTIIQLKDHSDLFQDPNSPQSIIRTGSIGTKDGQGPRAHNNYIFDMTFDIGKDNPGAIGVDFNASNTGAVENVEIVSQDGQGAVGLELTREVGPCLIKNVTIKGFDKGIRVASALYGITFENIHLEKQNQVGILNDSNVIAVRKLTSLNSVPALINKGLWPGPNVLIDSELRGGSPQQVAIENSVHLLVRNVNVEGYKAAIKNGDDLIMGSRVEEFISSEPLSLFDSDQTTLNLAVIETPKFSDPNLNNWANVKDYGANPDDKLDDSLAIQKAIDSGKTTVYFPNGRYTLDKPAIVRGNVRRLIGFNSPISSSKGFLRFENQKHPVIVERFNCFGNNKCQLENATSQPVVLRHSTGALFSTTSATGTWFIENVVTPRFHIGKNQKLYARQLNCESPPPEPLLKNDGGQVWLFGYKTEFGNTVAATLNSGKTEILGGLFYPSQGVKDPKIPVLINRDSSVTAVYREIAFGSTYTIQIIENRKEKTKTLNRQSLGKGNMIAVPLYVGY